MTITQLFKQSNLDCMYSQSLLLTIDKKTCTNLSDSLNKSHDSIYRNFRDEEKTIDEISTEIVKEVKKVFGNKPLIVIPDETALPKNTAKKIEGLYFVYDGSQKRSVVGLQVMTFMLTDGERYFPVAIEYVISKKINKKANTKSELFQELLLTLEKQGFNITCIIADGHYSTLDNLRFLHKKNQQFLIKIRRDRKVTVNQQTQNLYNVLRLNKNEKSKSLSANIGDMKLFFYVFKNDSGKTIYLVSLFEIPRKKVKKLYAKRWHIEKYHRTIKQKLGFNDCQMRAIKKQTIHILFVMRAYIFVENLRYFLNFKSVDEVIRYLRKLKSTNMPFPIDALPQDFHQHA